MADLDVALRLRADASGLVGEVRLSKQELDRLGREAQRAGGRAGRARRGWASFGREMEASRRRATALRLAMIALATGGAARVGASFLSAASDAEELRSQFAAVFRELTGEARAWARAHAEAVGRSSLDIQQYLATLQDTFVPLGFARREAFEYSRTLAELGVDLASFKNAAEPETIDLLTSAIVGNHEAVRRFGIVITESTLKQELMNAGIAGGVQAATEQDKILARLRIILRSTADAQGDAARTADQYANRVRALTGDWRGFQVLFGQSLIPTAQTGIALLRDLLRELSDGADPDQLGREIENRFRSVLLGAAGAAPLDIVATVVNELATAFNELPPWVQEIGILGAVLLGRKGRAALLGVTALSGIVDALKPDVEDIERRVRRQYELARRTGFQGSFDAYLRAPGVQATGGALLAPDGGASDGATTIAFSLIGRGRGDGGPGARTTLAELFRRFDEDRRRRAQAKPPGRKPLALPGIPGAGPGAGGAGGFEDVLGATAGLAAAQRAVDEFYAGLEAEHLDAVRAIEGAELDLATPFERATAEATRWRDETLASLDPTAEGYEELAARIEAVFLERIARAAEESAERQKRAAEEARSGWEKALEDYAADAIDTSDEIEQATTRALGGMEDALVDFVTTGKLSFSSLVDSIIADLTRIAIRQAIIGPLTNALGGAFGGGGGGGLPTGGGGGDFNFGPGVNPFHGGGVAGLGRVARHGVDPRAFIGAPRLHGGGIAGDEVPTILRRGEGVFTPEQMAALGSQPPPVNVEIQIYDRGTQKTYRQERQFTAEDGRRVIRVVADDVAAGGDTARAIRTVFGVAPPART